jgi:coenzyme F420-reducing hydrogenase delta subunit
MRRLAEPPSRAARRTDGAQHRRRNLVSGIFIRITRRISGGFAVRFIRWFCGEPNVFENQRKATDCEYDSGDDKSKKRVAKVEDSQLATAAGVVMPRLLRRSQ